jgi:hypothetical protein
MTTRERAVSLRRLGLLALASLCLLAPAGARAALPREGVLVPGQSLGGISLGMTQQQVAARWGSRHGRCRSCLFTTWYYTYRPFEPQGAAVEFFNRRVTRVYTLWKPAGWRTPDGLALGVPAEEVAGRYGALPRHECTRYTAVLRRGVRTITAFYLFEGQVWGFGLLRPDASPCIS